MSRVRQSSSDSARLAEQVLRAVDRRRPSPSIYARLERRGLALVGGAAAAGVRIAGRVVRG